MPKPLEVDLSTKSKKEAKAKNSSIIFVEKVKDNSSVDGATGKGAVTTRTVYSL